MKALFKPVSEQHPPPHARYVVIRNSVVVTATPCYGMHNPWWVVTTLEKEVDPLPMDPTDLWLPLIVFHGEMR